MEILEKEIKKLDDASDNQELCEVGVARKRALTAQLWQWLKRKERFWIQHSRLKALREKDRNTKYFHLIATIRKNRKLMGKLKAGERVVKNLRAIKKEAIKFFKQLCTADCSICLKHNGNRLAKLSRQQSDELEIIPSREEINRAVWSYESTKAPGCDGFNLGFIKKMWNFVGEEFVNMITDFFENGELPKAVNTTWVALIPKLEGAVELKDFRPISIVGCIYKIIAKILAIGVKKMMPT